MSLHPHPSYYSQHDWDYCHDDMHVDGDSCPNCGGYLMGCTDSHQTPSAAPAKTATPSGTEGRAPGREVETRSPATPSRPDAHDRVTYRLPLAVEQDVHDADWTVTVHLTDEARRQLARDLVNHHMADLVLMRRLTAMERDNRHAGNHGAAARTREELATVENRLAGALQATATTQWVHTPRQAEQLADDLHDAQADPDTCAVGTCSAYATPGGSYCAPHDERGC